MNTGFEENSFVVKLARAVPGNLFEQAITKEDVMKKRILLVCVMIFAATVFASDFARDFQSAMELYNGGKFSEAESAFVNLSEQKASPQGIDGSLAYAAYSAEQQKKSDKAIEFAGKIKDKSLNMYCRMKLMEIQRKWDEIIAISKDEDFNKWPESLIYNASFCRGTAYRETKNAENSEKDLLNAAKNTANDISKASVYEVLGNMYRDVSKDNQKALDAMKPTLDKLLNESTDAIRDPGI